MDTQEGQFYTFLLKEKTRAFFAFVLYVLFIVMIIEIDLPLAVDFIRFIIQLSIILFYGALYMSDWMDKYYERKEGKLKKNKTQNIKKIGKEILMYIAIFLIVDGITSFVLVGQTENQANFEESFYKAPILNSIFAIIICPIIEELIFRFLPYKFIKNKALYIIVSGVVFAAMHVLGDSNPLYNIWFYMIRALYYGYRYYKTKNLWVPISIHMTNNLIATLLFVFS